MKQFRWHLAQCSTAAALYVRGIRHGVLSTHPTVNGFVRSPAAAVKNLQPLYPGFTVRPERAGPGCVRTHRNTVMAEGPIVLAHRNPVHPRRLRTVRVRRMPAAVAAAGVAGGAAVAVVAVP